jgi:hypothetical protein
MARRTLTPTDPGQLLNTAAVAQKLTLSPWTVRYLARTAQLACETTPSGQYLFRKRDVTAFGLAREEARLTGVTARRPKKPGTPGEPRQMSLLGTQLRVVRPRARSSTDPLMLARQFLKESHEV